MDTITVAEALAEFEGTTPPAPKRTRVEITSSLEQIPITAIRPSMTQIQQLRRSHFNPDKLAELADSIRAQGLLQPILVRPVVPQGITKYELVAGERRWLAADRAGFAHIDCHVRDLSDEQVLEAQLVENLQREDIHPLEEAEGYRELIQLKSLKADDLAALIGKSKAYVYARLKLLDLCQEARAAVDAGLIDASKALLVARLPGEKLQKKALELVSEKNWRDEPISYREALSRLRAKLMENLTQAPFGLDAELTHGKGKLTGDPLPVCVSCPNYSRNDPELQAEVGAGAHVCMDSSCFELKVKTYWAAQAAAAESAGRKVLRGSEGLAAIPNWDGVSDRYVDLDGCSDEEYPEPEPAETGDEAIDEAARDAYWAKESAFQPRTYRQLLADAKPTIVLAEGKGGKLHELVPVDEAEKLLKARGIKLNIPQRQLTMPATDNAQMKLEREKQEARQAREREVRRRVFLQIHAKWKGPLKRDDLVLVANHFLDVCGRPDALDALYPEKSLDMLHKLSELELGRLLVLLTVADRLDGYGSPASLFDLAKRLKIDPAKIKKEIDTEARAQEKPKAEASAKAPAAGRTAAKQAKARK